MTWGFFTVTHIISLALVGAFVVGMHFLLKRFSRRTQTAVLGSLSFLGIGAIIFNLVAWGSPLEELPLHLCAFNAMVLPLTVFTRNKTLGNLLLVWCLGALAALVLNNEKAGVSIFSWEFAVYYFPHVVEFGIPLLLVTLGHIKKDPKCILSTVLLTMAIYTLVHFCNLALNSFIQANQIRNPEGEIILANYMYSIAPNNPLAALFQKIIPYTYWHMYLVVPILVVYLLIVYAPELRAFFKNRKAAKV